MILSLKYFCLFSSITSHNLCSLFVILVILLCHETMASKLPLLTTPSPSQNQRSRGQNVDQPVQFFFSCTVMRHFIFSEVLERLVCTCSELSVRWEVEFSTYSMSGTVGCMLILSWLVSLARWDSVVHKPKKYICFGEFEMLKFWLKVDSQSNCVPFI